VGGPNSGVAGYDPTGFTPLLKNFAFPASQQATALAFAQSVYVCMSAWSVSVQKTDTIGWNTLLGNIIGGNLSTDFLPFQDTQGKEVVKNLLTVLSKSVQRGVPDYTNSLYSDQATWYPDPALKTGGQQFNAFNLNPFVWFIHAKLGLSGYAFALDDDLGNVESHGTTNMGISVGGLSGPLTQSWTKDPYTPVAPFGVVTTTAAAATAQSSTLTNLANQNLVQQIKQFDYNHNQLGTLVNGPGVQVGTTVQFTSINPTPSLTTITLSRPLTSATTTTDTFAFFGHMIFTGTVLGKGQPTDTINLDGAGAQDAFNTLNKLGPLQTIQVNGPGIPVGTVVTIKALTQQNGVIQVELLGPNSKDFPLKPSLISKPGGSYGYTFGSPQITPIRDAGFEWINVQGGTNFNHGSQASITTVDWTFTDSTTNNTWFAGIAANGSTYLNAVAGRVAPQGQQVAFITGDSSITKPGNQPVSPALNLQGGKYQIAFMAAQMNSTQAHQSIQVLVDGNPVGTITPKGTSFAQSQTPVFTVKSGTHTITFQGTQKSDSTVLFDVVVLKPVGTSLTSAVAKSV
jgi:hypothetical protein